MLLIQCFWLLLVFAGTGVCQQVPLRQKSWDKKRGPLRIAIIGGGAAGASAAYHFSKFAEESDQDIPLSITIYDRNARIGGRTTTVNALHDPRYPTELGASIFVEVNHILANASRDFNLSTKDKIYESTGSKYDLGVWNGAEFVFTVTGRDNGNDNGSSWQSKLSSWWDIAKLLWKYGFSPIKTQRAMKSAVGSFLRMYDDLFPFESLDEPVQVAGLQDFTGVTGETALQNAGVNDRFAREVVQASTRVNYAQNFDTIHGLETMVCMAIEGAMSIDGGNWQIFDEMVKRSKANVRLNSTVTKVSRHSKSTYRVHYDVGDDQEAISSAEYDTIILAAPYHDAGIKWEVDDLVVPEKVEYVDLFVTLFTTSYRPSPKFFGVETQEDVPDSILTTLPEGLDLNRSRGPLAVGPARFWSLSLLRVIDQTIEDFDSPMIGEIFKESESRRQMSEVSGGTASHERTHHNSQPIFADQSRNVSTGKQYLYKIFSPTPVNATFLNLLFEFGASPITSRTAMDSGATKDLTMDDLGQKYITWFHEKHWHSYPYLPPRTHFPSSHLDEPLRRAGFPNSDKTTNHTLGYIPHAGNGRGIWYTSAIETFISTMETSALMGMNIARLVLDGFKAELALIRDSESEETSRLWAEMMCESLDISCDTLEKPKDEL